MKEFQEFSALYQKQKQYKVKVVGLTFFLLILVTVFVLINTRRINPFMLYVVAMGVVIFYAVKTRKVSPNYDLLLTFVKKNKPELLKEKELLFFIDYKLDKRYEKDPERLVKQLKSPKQKKQMLKKIKEQESNFKSLTDPKKQSKKKGDNLPNEIKTNDFEYSCHFFIGGAVTTTVDSSKYQQIEELQAKQEAKMKKAIASEFITPEETQTLNTDMENFRRAQKTESRKILLEMIDKEKSTIKKIEKNLVHNEAEIAKKELFELKNQYRTLEVQSKEAFVFKEDKNKVVEIKKEIDQLPKSIKKVQPIRAISIKVGELSASIRKVQTEAKSASDKLKELNNQSEELSEKNYLGSTDRDALEKDREKNNQLIKNSDSILAIETREKESKELIDKLSKKSDETEKDFKDNEENARNLSKFIETLLKEGELHSDEKTELNKIAKTLTESLDLKEYKPGDLGKNYSAQKETYDKYEKNNLDRKAEKKKKEEEEKAAKEKAKKEEEEKKRKEAASSHSEVWHKAPAGKRYVDKESQLTYKQVKNPSNFEEISEEEATKYKPGHDNGSAKQ